jgi:hypothetical protein
VSCMCLNVGMSWNETGCLDMWWLGRLYCVGINLVSPLGFDGLNISSATR